MIIVYAISAIWAISCCVLPLWGALCLWKDGDDGMAACLLGLAFPFGCLMACLPWAFIAESQSPDLATLKKNEWVCSQTVTRGYGKTLHSVCVEYTAIQ